jgi:hypothetical protein
MEVVDNYLEWVELPGMHPQGVGLYFLILLLIYFYLVTYKADGQLPVLWKDVEDMLLSGTLPSQVYKMLGHDFYIAFYMNIKAVHYNYMKQTYKLTDEQLLKSHELDNSFVQHKCL